MATAIIATLTILALALIVYHHVGYPLILARLARDRSDIRKQQRTPLRGYRLSDHDNELPRIAIVIPAYNEQEHIAEKLRNLAALDYPADRLEVVVACDGCSDNTADVAWAVAQEPECSELRLQIFEFRNNRGKVAVLNKVIPTLNVDLIALSDVTALVSVDALMITADRFAQSDIGVVSGTYQLLSPSGAGESAYWNYQTQIKLGEGALGSTMGVHGAFYAFRANLFEPLEADIINDDFVLPMRIVARGFRAVYEPRIHAFELEPTSLDQDRHRRLRIAAGNLQQLIRLRELLSPRFGGVAFAFASGKALRALMPACLLMLLLGSAYLSAGEQSRLFVILFSAQAFAYAIATLVHVIGPAQFPAPMQTIHYLIQGHMASLVGEAGYIYRALRCRLLVRIGRNAEPAWRWQRVNELSPRHVAPGQ